MLHVTQAILNIVKTVDAVKDYIEKEFVPEIRRGFKVQTVIACRLFVFTITYVK